MSKTIKKRGEIIHIADTIAVRLFGPDDAAIKWIAFPFIGGNSSHFRTLAEYLTEEWQLVAVDPPAHGQARGKPVLDIYTLTELYFQLLKPYFKGRFYLFGHSLGGLVAYLLASRLEEAGHPPGGTVLSAIAPPLEIRDFNGWGDRRLGIEDLNAFLMDSGDKYAAMAGSSMAKFYLPLLNLDYRLLRSFEPERIAPPILKGKVWIMGSKEDPLSEWDHLGKWEAYAKNIHYLEAVGRHQYILTHAETVADKMIRCVAGTAQEGEGNDDSPGRH